MSTEENKALVRRFFEEMWVKGNLSAADELLATNFVFHPPPGVAPDLEGYKQWVSMTCAGLADRQSTVEDQTAEGDKVVTRWTYRGTHKGELMGIAPTGKQVTVTGISIDRIVGGKIVEEWNEIDNLGMMQQLGVVPSPGQAGG
jgi:predicted ester cyclase